MAEKSQASCWKKGELVLKVKPLVAVIAKSSLLICGACDNCLVRKTSTKCCPKCRAVVYCGNDCLIDAWAYHMFECSHFISAKPQLSPSPSNDPPQDVNSVKQLPSISQAGYSLFFTKDSTRLAVKLAALFVRKRKLTLQKLKDEVGLKTLADLDHLDSITGGDELNSVTEHQNIFVTMFNEMCVENYVDPLPSDLLARLYRIAYLHKLSFNAMSTSIPGVHIYDYFLCFGIFPSLAALKVSCSPSAACVHYKGALRVVAAAGDIPRRDDADFSQVSIVWRPPLKHVSARFDQERLILNSTSSCQCERCEEERKAPLLVRCASQDCFGRCSMDRKTFQCSNCDRCGGSASSKTEDTAYVSSYYEKLLKAQWNTIMTQKQYIHAVSKLLSLESNPFHPLDLACLSLYEMLGAQLVRSTDLTKFRMALNIYRDILIPGLELYTPWDHVFVGLLYLKTHLISLGLKEDSGDYLDKALDHLMLILDEDSGDVECARNAVHYGSAKCLQVHQSGSSA